MTEETKPAAAAVEAKEAVQREEAPVALTGRRSWLYEAPVFYAALIAFQRMAFPENPFWHGISPSPAWVGVLLFAMRYGIGSGLSVGLAAAALCLLGVRAVGESYRFGDADFWFEPALFVLVGTAVGGTADGYMHRINDLLRALADLKGRNSGLQQHIVSQQKAMRVIEQQVVSQMSSVVTLYQGSRRLGRLEMSDVFEAFLDFFTRALQATKTGLYVPKDGAWVLHGSRGWGEKEGYPERVESGKGIVGSAALEKRPSSLRDWLVGSFEAGAEMPDRTDAIMAAPILGPEGDVVAVFAVHAMPFLRFNSASLNLLTLLAEWGAEAYGKCQGVSDLRNRSILDEEYSVHSPAYFTSRVRQEFARSRRYALPFSLLLVTPAPEDGMGRDRRVHYLRSLCRLLRETVREGDVVARTGLDDVPFALILVTTTREQAEEARKRIAGAYAGVGLPSGARFGVGSYAHTMSDSGEVIEQARGDLR
jgi:GGDEF domain-containing protein